MQVLMRFNRILVVVFLRGMLYQPEMHRPRPSLRLLANLLSVLLILR